MSYDSIPFKSFDVHEVYDSAEPVQKLFSMTFLDFFVGQQVYSNTQFLVLKKHYWKD